MFKKVFFNKAFTLVEIMISVIITGILFVLLAKVYILASNLYVYHRAVKSVEGDILYFNQVLQNLADSSQVDFDAYSGSNLANFYGFTGNLYLKDDKFKYKLFNSGGVIYLEKTKLSSNQKLLLALTNSGTTIVDKLKFKVIPYYDPFKIFTPDNQQPMVEVFLDIKNRFYNPKTWYLNVRYFLQEAFNFKYYNN